jgi:hypothetical protein
LRRWQVQRQQVLELQQVQQLEPELQQVLEEA